MPNSKFAIVLTVGSIAVMAGCSSGKPTADKPYGAAPSAAISANNATPTAITTSLVMIECGSETTFTLSFLTPDTGSVISKRTFSLPPNAVPAQRCSSLYVNFANGRNYSDGSTWTARTMFDHEFRRMAVTIQHDNGSSGVGFLADNGVLTELVGVSEAFGATTNRRWHAMFGRDDDTLWFLDGSTVHQVEASFGAQPAVRGQMPAGHGSLWPVIGSTFATGSSKIPAGMPSPNGQQWATLEYPTGGASDSTGYPHNITLRDRPGLDGKVIASQRFETQCFPDHWISDTEILCLTKNGNLGERFGLIKVNGTSMALNLLLPENDRANGEPVASHGQIYFVAKRHSIQTLYRVALGADVTEPTKIKDLDSTFTGHLLAVLG